MRTHSSLLILFILSFSCFGQFHERIYFNNLYNQNTWSSALSLIEADSAYFICGVTSDSIVGYKSIVILKLTLEGNIDFWKEFRVNNSDHYPGRASSLISKNNALFNAGSFSIFGQMRSFDYNGDTIWTKTIDTNGGYQTIIDDFDTTNQNNFVAVGQIGVPGNQVDVLLVVLDTQGIERHREIIGWSYADQGFKVLSSSNNFLLSGYTYNPSNSYSGDALFIKTDSVGNMLWFKSLGHPGFRDGYGSVTLAQDGNYVFGYAHAVSQGPPYPVPEAYCKIKFMKFNQDGDTIWERMYGHAFQYNMLQNIITLHDGSFIAVGYAQSDTISGPIESWLFKINEYGDSIWFRNYRHYTSDILDLLYDVYETSDHGLIACGVSSHTIPGPESIQRIWVLRLDSAGCEEPGCDLTIGVEEEAGKRGRLEIWPNPASGEIHVRLNMDDGRFYRDCELVIYDVFGREVAEIIIPDRQDQIQINVASYPPGVYIVILRNGYILLESSKFVVVK